MKLSVIIPCFKQAHYLSAAISGVRAEARSDTEVVVVNDGSPDNTSKVARSFGNEITLIEKSNAGLSAARNTGIVQSTGELLYFLDADDQVEKGFCGKIIEAAECQPAVQVFHGECKWVDLEGRILKHKRAQSLSGDPLETLLQANPFQPCQVAVRRNALARVGLFDEELRACEDWDVWIRLATAGAHFGPVEGAVSIYRRHPGSMSNEYFRMREAGHRVYTKFRQSSLGKKYQNAVTEGEKHYVRCSCFSRLIKSLKAAALGDRVRMLTRAVRQDPEILFLVASYVYRARRERTFNAIRSSAR